MDDLEPANAVERIEVDARTRTATIGLRGDVDLANADALMSAIEPVLSQDDVDILVLDLRNLDFLDSSGLAVILRAARRGKAVRLSNPPAIVRDLLRVTGLSDLLATES